MPTRYTKFELFARGSIAFQLGVLAVLISAPEFQQMVPKGVYLAVACYNGGLVAFRQWMDKSSGQGDTPTGTPDSPLTVQAPPNEPVKTEVVEENEVEPESEAGSKAVNG